MQEQCPVVNKKYLKNWKKKEIQKRSGKTGSGNNWNWKIETRKITARRIVTKKLELENPEPEKLEPDKLEPENLKLETSTPGKKQGGYITHRVTMPYATHWAMYPLLPKDAKSVGKHRGCVLPWGEGGGDFHNFSMCNSLHHTTVLQDSCAKK